MPLEVTMKSCTKVVLLAGESPICKQIQDRFLNICDQAINKKNVHDQTKISTVWGFPICRLIHPRYVDRLDPSDHLLVVYLFDPASETLTLPIQKSVKEMFHYTGKDLFLDNEVHHLYPTIPSRSLYPYHKDLLSNMSDPSYLDISIQPTSSSFSLEASIRFIADVLLALTSPSFLQAAANQECRSAFEWKMHLLQRRVTELPQLDELLNIYSCDELDKMRCGGNYDPNKPKLEEARRRSQLHGRIFSFSASPENPSEQKSALQSLLCSQQKCHITPPFFSDYGFNIYAENFYANSYCTFLDCGLIIIGEDTMFGPNVDIYTVTHPVEPVERKTLAEFTAPVIIGKNCWIGGKSVIVAGIRIGDNAVVGAGSVVTKDVPANSVVAGNPAKFIRYVTNE